MDHVPSGKEREVTATSASTIDGAPVAYVVVLATVIAVLAAIPLSVVLGAGTSFPMSQAVYPLVGWLLGPIAGAAADGIGALVGVFLFPHTSFLPPATILGALVGGVAAGVMRKNGGRKLWWIPLGLCMTLAYVGYAGWAVLVNGITLPIVLLGSFIDWSALLLFLLPTRVLFASWIENKNIKRVAAGLFGGTWIVAGLSHLSAGALIYLTIGWPAEVWVGMAPLAPFEHLLRALIGAVVGAGVIAGLRSIGLVKPKQALY